MKVLRVEEHITPILAAKFWARKKANTLGRVERQARTEVDVISWPLWGLQLMSRRKGGARRLGHCIINKQVGKFPIHVSI